MPPNPPPQNLLLHTDERIAIALDLVDGWLYVDWRGPQTPASVRDGCGGILKAVRAAGPRQVLNDNTRVVGGWHDLAVLGWARDEWFPALWAAGVLEFAWVQSPSAESRASANESLSRLARADADRCMLFLDAADAADWLRLRKRLGGDDRKWRPQEAAARGGRKRDTTD